MFTQLRSRPVKKGERSLDVACLCFDKGRAAKLADSSSRSKRDFSGYKRTCQSVTQSSAGDATGRVLAACCSLVNGRNTFSFPRLHGGYWLLLRAPRMYSSEQAPAYIATVHHTPLPRQVRSRRGQINFPDHRLSADQPVERNSHSTTCCISCWYRSKEKDCITHAKEKRSCCATRQIVFPLVRTVQLYKTIDSEPQFQPESSDFIIGFSGFPPTKVANLNTGGGDTLAERLTCSPPTKAIRVQFSAGSLRIFARGNRARRCRWSAVFLGDLPFPPPVHSGAISVVTAGCRRSRQSRPRDDRLLKSTEGMSEEIWSALNSELLRNDEGDWVEYGAAPERNGGRKRGSLEKPPTAHRPDDPTHAEIRSDPPEIEPVSLQYLALPLIKQLYSQLKCLVCLQRVFSVRGIEARHNRTAVTERLACSPPTQANRVQPPTGPLQDFRMWKSCRAMPLVSGFSQGSSVSAAAPYSPLSPSSALKDLTVKSCQIHFTRSSLTRYSTSGSCHGALTCDELKLDRPADKFAVNKSETCGLKAWCGGTGARTSDLLATSRPSCS
ncbi:hypothetical protein PR048_017970 [Dryococelus australis]|uniref:Uncharacterized protein n=1 Tax=Dryococelus australis TaxID=614101 RepID=A0ABQ9HB39_9NEOP|nr:hypothetical protein PR048_017970 [Dryococelus australis]